MIDFIGIGTQKGGTTWLHHQLAKHPAVCVPRRKELRYFQTGVLEHDLGWYLSQWPRGPEAGLVRGEITPDYAPLPPEIAREIGRLFPGAKILLTIRNPIEQVWSHCRVHRLRWKADEGTPLTRVDALLYALQPQTEYYSDYSRVLDTWGSVFGDDRVHVILFDDIAQRPHEVMRDLWSFLGVEDIALADQQVSRAVNKSPEAPMPGIFRGAISARWAPRVRALNERLGGRVDAWVDDLERHADERALERVLEVCGRRRPSMLTGTLPAKVRDRWDRIRERLSGFERPTPASCSPGQSAA